MFQTLEEAEEMVRDCVICGKPKHRILYIAQADMPERYELHRCNDEYCNQHCKGHPVDTDSIVHEHWREPVKLS